MSLTSNTCPRCGVERAADDLDGLCPSCLLLLAASEPGKPPVGEQAADAHRKPPAPGASPTTTPVAMEGTTRAELTMDSIRQLFPHLEIERTLGQGGMGIVFLARQRHLDRPVALKIIAPEIAGNPTFAERFSREARTTARLNHKNVAMVYDFGEVEGVYFMVMEYVEGRSLRELIQGGGPSLYVAIEIMLQVCDALSYAHQAGVVHRDIKPENVIVGLNGQVKVVDFGLAKLTNPAQRDLTLTGTRQVMGTPRYMSPEQMDAPQSVDHRSDIYSAGVILYELLTGELPTGHFDPPSKRGLGDAMLDDIVMRTLARDPEQRFQTIGHLRTELELAMSHQRQQAKPPRIEAQPLAPQTSFANQWWPSDDGEQLTLVAKGLLVTAGLQWFVANLVLLVTLVFFENTPRHESWFTALLTTGVLGASLTMFGAIRMWRRESYWLSYAACAAAMVCCPANLLGLPIGVIGLALLSREEARRQFAGHAPDGEHPVPGRERIDLTSAFLLTSAVMNLLMGPMWVTMMWRDIDYRDQMWLMLLGIAWAAGAVQFLMFGLSRTGVLKPLVCLALVWGLFVPAPGWPAAVIAFLMSIPGMWKWRVFGWIRRGPIQWIRRGGVEWAVGLVGCLLITAVTSSAAVLVYSLIYDNGEGTYSLYESEAWGVEPQSQAYSQLRFEATGNGDCVQRRVEQMGFDKIVWRIHLQSDMQSAPADGELVYSKARGFTYLDRQGEVTKGNSLQRDDVLKWMEMAGVDITKPGVGLEAAVIAKATADACQDLQSGAQPGVGKSLNRAAFSDPRSYLHRHYHPPRHITFAVTLVAILIGFVLNGLWVQRVYSRARGTRGEGEVQLPKTQFGGERKG